MGNREVEDLVSVREGPGGAACPASATRAARLVPRAACLAVARKGGKGAKAGGAGDKPGGCAQGQQGRQSLRRG